MMLTDSIKFAIAKEFSEIKLEPGEESFIGEVILDVDVVVTKGKPTYTTPTAKILTKEFLAYVIYKTGYKKDKIAQLIQDAYFELQNKNVNISEVVETTDKALDFLEDEIISKLPLIPRAGNTKVKGIVRIQKLLKKRK